MFRVLPGHETTEKFLYRKMINYIEVNDLINVKENGEMLTHNSIKFLARIIRDDLHIPFKFHNLRHTYKSPVYI